ncbi:NADH dehydrogenase (quinone) subunit D [Sulfurimonas sp.]|uniref:NADH dehydrogenase (quinone) subunit D n=1 Tax=Sulfurimonas sp. TaxID=2022749 RepID=UPI0025EC2901|nr:NADH dehydrogenase (quinone) subunit D [Sulfurimonas sp.]
MHENFQEKFKDLYTKDSDGIYVLDKDDLHSAIKCLKDEDEFHFLVDVTAVDYSKYLYPKASRFCVVYLLRNKDFKEIITIKSFLDDQTLEIQSITDLFQSSNWAEREVWDQYGIKFLDHPNLKRVLNHQGFEGHPLRKDYPIIKGQICNETDDLMDEMIPRLAKKGYTKHDDLMFLNLGPAHPASHGTIRTFVALEGETIVSAVTEIGYLHRGFEKSCENHTYNQIIPYTDRLNYCSAILNNIAFAHTVEGMLGLTLPDRAQFIRVIVGELSRIIDHLVCLAANLVDMGALTNYWYLYNPRETVYTLFSKLTGARLTNSYMRIGGVAHDLYDGFEEDLNHCIKDIEKGMSDALSLVEKNRIFHDRTQNIGVVSAAEAINKGFSGPNLRASGVAYDMRKTAPYNFYESFDFDIAVGSVGDVYDRLMVRFEEIRQSISIIKQAMNKLPSGDIIVNDRAVSLPAKNDVYNSIEGVMNHFKIITDGVKVPTKEYYRAIEGANGELGFYIVSDGTGTPYKVKVRPPCFAPMSALPEMLEGGMIADSVISLGSLNIIAGELDR